MQQKNGFRSTFKVHGACLTLFLCNNGVDALIAVCGTVTITILNTVTNTVGHCGNTFDVTRTWRATDACGNSAECSQKVTVEDHTPPTISCALNKTVECASTWTFDAPTASDTCGNATITVLNTVTNLTGHCGNTFDVTRTWRATDVCGNSAECSQKVTVEDHTPPTITCVPNKTVECASAWSFDAPTATDSCGNVTLTILNTVTNTTGHCGNTFDVTRTWRATDACGNSATCVQTISVRDTAPPTITCAPDRIVQPGVAWSFDDPVATDTCGALVVQVIHTVTNATDTDTLVATRTWQATDACGNTSTCQQSITVWSGGLPVITSQPQSQTLACGSDATLSVTATGTGPLAYQWICNGSDLPGATSSSLTLSDLQFTNAGLYKVLVSNPVGTVTSSTAVLNVVPPAQAPVDLGSAANFGVLAGSAVISTGATTVNANLGVSPGTTLTGVPTVNGTTHLGDPAAAQAQLDLTSAYEDAAGRTVGAVTVAGDLGGLSLTPGLYQSTSSLEISSGDLILDALGDTNAVFIFQIQSTLTTTSGRQVVLIGGAQAANIFWQVGTSATLGTESAVKGTILADQSITLMSSATLEGRALARTGVVTLDGNIIGFAIPTDTTAPTVSATVPANATTGVAISSQIAFTFSETMDPSTISTATFTLKQGTTPVAGTVNYNGVTATFTPAGNLAPLTTYTATITTGATDLAGNPLTSAMSWTFTTGAAPDTTAPSVSATVPADATTGVSISSQIAFTFSEAMDPSTISTATFTLKQGTTPVAGTVNYNGVTATFTPAGDFAPLTTYTATITTGAKDLAGNPLTSDLTWAFTTGRTPVGQEPVALGSASNFGVLSGSMVTSTGATTVYGDLGVSPGTALTGAPTVNGTTHLGDASATQAQLDLTAAYNNVAERTDGAISVTGDLGGLTLTPGLYQSTSSLEISSGDLILDARGDTNAVFIFQVESTLITASGRQVILIGGAQASNVFWQVGSSATLGTDSVFQGTILADQSITLMTGATLEGRALTLSGTVTLDSNTITTPTATPALVLQSAAVVNGPYADVAGQTRNSVTKVIVVPASGGMQFYRIRSDTSRTITGITVSGGNVVLTYY